MPGAYVVTLDAEPALYVERGGKGLVPLRDPDESWLRPALEALADAVRRGRVTRLGIERFLVKPFDVDLLRALISELACAYDDPSTKIFVDTAGRGCEAPTVRRSR